MQSSFEMHAMFGRWPVPGLCSGNGARSLAELRNDRAAGLARREQLAGCMTAELPVERARHGDGTKWYEQGSVRCTHWRSRCSVQDPLPALWSRTRWAVRHCPAWLRSGARAVSPAWIWRKPRALHALCGSEQHACWRGRPCTPWQPALAAQVRLRAIGPSAEVQDPLEGLLDEPGS